MPVKLPRLIIYLIALLFCLYLSNSKVSYHINKDAIVQVHKLSIPKGLVAEKPIDTASFALLSPIYVTPVIAVAVAYPQSDNAYKAFIYSHESGNDPTKWNSSGCLGLGQACPASKLLNVCPTMDYACEDAYFSSYASKYGGWSGAYAFWLANSWW